MYIYIYMCVYIYIYIHIYCINKYTSASPRNVGLDLLKLNIEPTSIHNIAVDATGPPTTTVCGRRLHHLKVQSCPLGTSQGFHLSVFLSLYLQLVLG